MFKPDRATIKINGDSYEVPHRIFDILPRVNRDVYYTRHAVTYKDVEPLLLEILTGFTGKFVRTAGIWNFNIAFLYKYIPNHYTHNISEGRKDDLKEKFYDYLSNIMTSIENRRVTVVYREDISGHPRHVNLDTAGISYIESRTGKSMLELFNDYVKEKDIAMEIHVFGLTDGNGVWEM